MPTVSFNTHFPGYNVLGELGRGNARVLKARHEATGDLVAIKHFAFNTDEETLRRFQQESEIMTRIAHPNIVKVREIRLDAQLPYIVMELIEGGSVRQLLDQQRILPVATVIRLGLQVVEAFKVIHSQGIVHRDIKPENVLYRQLPSGEYHFLLTDFGIARLREQPATVTGQSLMTYEYASPEQFENPRNVGEATDYYSLGVMLYECLTGRVPFPMNEGVGIITFMNTVLNTPPPPVELPGQPLPDSLRKLLPGLLAKKAGERLSSSTAMKVALKQAELEQIYLEQEGLTSPPVVNVPPERTGPVITPAAARKTLEPPAGTRSASRQDDDFWGEKKRRRNHRMLQTGLLALSLLAAGFAAYLILSNRKMPSLTSAINKEDTTRPSATATPTDSEQARLDSARRRAEAAFLLEQKRKEALASAKLLRATVVGSKVGILGGIKNLRIRVDNPTKLTFTSIRVLVRYIKDNGGVYKTETMYFNNMGPGDSRTRTAPESPRGTRVSVRIAAYDSPDIPQKPLSSDPIDADR